MNISHMCSIKKESFLLPRHSWHVRSERRALPLELLIALGCEASDCTRMRRKKGQIAASAIELRWRE